MKRSAGWRKPSRLTFLRRYAAGKESVPDAEEGMHTEQSWLFLTYSDLD